jgi:hypothetical protein
VTGPPGDRLGLDSGPPCARPSGARVLGPGETVWLRTRADFDPKLNLDLKRPARSRQLWTKSARFVTGAERGS